MAKFSIIPKSKYLRIGMALSLVLVVLGIIFLLFFMMSRSLFSGNQHFTLRFVKIESGGWWGNKSGEVCRLLHIEPGKTNLFQLDLATLREKLLKEPSIEKVSISRLLPDTLNIKIEERIPRAFLGRKNSPFLVDSTGIVMSKKSCFNIDESLPVIIELPKSIRNQLKPGRRIKELDSVLKLLNLTRIYYPEFKITTISLRGKDQLVFLLHFKQRRNIRYTVQMPRENIKYMLDILKSALLQAKRSNNTKSRINLLFDGNVIFK